MAVCDVESAFDAAFDAGLRHKQAEAAVERQDAVDVHAADLDHERKRYARLLKKFEHLIPPGQCPGNVDSIEHLDELEEPTSVVSGGAAKKAELSDTKKWRLDFGMPRVPVAPHSWTYKGPPVKITDKKMPDLVVSTINGPEPLEFPDEAVCLVVWAIGWLMVPLTWRRPPPVAWSPDGSSR